MIVAIHRKFLNAKEDFLYGFEINCAIHYGDTEGCDYMKGEDIVVIGTFNYNEMVYRLFAAHLGVEVNTKVYGSGG